MIIEILKLDRKQQSYYKLEKTKRNKNYKTIRHGNLFY